MEMIIGGAFQGKSSLAESKYPDIRWVKGAEADWEAISKAKGILGFHEYIRKELKEGREVTSLAKDLIQANPDVVIVSDEVGYGVVPIDAFDRLYREKVGRILCKAVEQAEEVYRVVAGIPVCIKGEKV